MKHNMQQILETRKLEVAHRTNPIHAFFGAPQLSHSPIEFEVAERTQAVSHGGLALIHQLVNQIGLVDALNRVPVLKLKLPYHESDHILNIVYNFLCGGTALEHIEYRRQDPVHLNMLGTYSIPDPTTAGDFCRRYSATQINHLQDYINTARLKVWALQPASFFEEATVDLDGTIAPTYGECKQGMDISYDGQWGYHPLIVSLANTKEVLYVQNRSGNRPSHEGAYVYIDKCIALLRMAGFKKIRFRGDTDFTQTKHLDRWDAAGVQFVFGIDAMKNLKEIAESLENTAWKRLERPPKYEVKTIPRGKRENVKEKIVEERGYRNLVLEEEHVAEIAYRPTLCAKDYRLVIIRKTISVREGQKLLLPEIRYFFYLTNDREKRASEIVFESNKRCNQENLIGQLKSGMNALRMPLDTLEANWMYLVCGSLAWSLKSWLALLIDANNRQESKSRRWQLLTMEFRTFMQAMIMMPAQVLQSGRRVVVRLLNVNDWTETFFDLVERFKSLRLARRE